MKALSILTACTILLLVFPLRLQAQTVNPQQEATKLKSSLDSLNQLALYHEQQASSIRLIADSIARRLDITNLYLMQTEGTEYYTNQDATIRSKPIVSSASVAVIPKGTKVIAYDTQGIYVKVQVGDQIG